MNWLTGLFAQTANPESTLTSAQRQTLEAWRALPKSDLTEPHLATRYVVVDVESSGLDMKRDRLISIGAVAVVSGRLDFSDAFQVVLR